jgi:type II secretory pathway pseudopilin PulG
MNTSLNRPFALGARRRGRGFSLVEVIVVTGIAVTLFTVILAMQFTASRTRVFTQERDIAREAAVARIEEIAGSNFATIQGSYDGVDFAVPGLVSSVAAEEVGTVVVDNTTAPASSELIRVTVQMRWLSKAGGGSPSTFELTTFLANREVQ